MASFSVILILEYFIQNMKKQVKGGKIKKNHLKLILLASEGHHVKYLMHIHHF